MSDIYYHIKNEENRIRITNSATEKLHILYNLIALKNSNNYICDNYRDIKKLVEYYIDVIKISDFGYDVINYNKIGSIISFLSFKEQISILKYSISIISRELPEHDMDWFLKSLKRAEISDITNSRKYLEYPKALFLYTSISIEGLLAVLIILYGLSYIVLLPAPIDSMEVFKIYYENYSGNFHLNHFMNILSLFAGINNNLIITSEYWYGALLLIFSKVIYLLIIVNFIYKKISDKILLK
jgi:hypothetical protein